MAQLHEYRYTLTGDTEFGGIVYTDAKIRIPHFEYFAEQMQALVTIVINDKVSSGFSHQLQPGEESVSAATVDALITHHFPNAVRTFPTSE